MCVDGAITAKCVSAFDDDFKASSQENRKLILKSKESIKFYCVYYAYRKKDLADFSIAKEIEARRKFIDEMFTSLRLETPVKRIECSICTLCFKRQ